MTSRSSIPKTLEYASSPKDWKPHGYQMKTMKFAVEHACALLLLDPGMGKTAITYGAFKTLKKRGTAEKMLVIAPLRPCHLVWPAEQEKWKDFAGLRVEVLHGPHKDAALARDADIYVINPEGLEWLFGVTVVRTTRIDKKTGKEKITTSLKHDMKRVKALGFDTLVIDELTMFKHSGALRFRMLKPVLKFFQRRWGLTGSFAASGLVDLFGQCYAIDEGRTLGPYVTHYKNEYFDAIGFGGYELVPKPGAEEKIYERLRPLALRLDARDYLDLPTMVPNTVFVDLPPAARKIYDELEKDFITQLECGSVVTAMNAAAKSTKLRQVACGGLYKQYGPTGEPLEKREWSNLHAEKTGALRELVDGNNGKPVLVAYEFGHDLDRLLKEFGKDTPVIGGGVSMARCKDIEREWNLGNIQVLLGHPAAMGHGLNLQQNSNTVAWHSLTWNLELFDQLNQRVLRQGNTHSHVFIHRLVARNTVDEAVILALGSKDKTQGDLLRALKSYAKGRRS